MSAAYNRLFGSVITLPSGALFRSKGIALVLASLCADAPILRAEVLAYIPQPTAGTVAVLDTDSGQVITHVKVGSNPIGVAVNPPMQTVYVTNSSSGTVSMIDMKTNRVVNTIHVGHTPMGVAVTPDGSRVYVANTADNTVSWFVAQNVTSSGLVPSTVAVSTIGGLNQPYGVAASSDGTSVYVTLRNSGQVAVISTATNRITLMNSTAALPAGIAETRAAYAPDCLWLPCHVPTEPLLWSADSGSALLSVFRSANLQPFLPIPTGQQPFAIGTFPFAGSPVYVANNQSNSLTVVDAQPADATSTGQVNFTTRQINLSAAPTGVGGTPDGKFAWVVENDGTVGQLRTAQNKVIQSVLIGNPGSGFGQFLAPRLGTTDLPALIGGSADLQVTVASDERTVTVVNGGPNAAAATELTVNLPAGVNFVSAKPTQGGCVTPQFGSAGVVRCNFGALAAGESASLLLDVSGAAMYPTAVVSDAFSHDPDSTNNSVSWPVNFAHPPVVFVPPPDFTVTQDKGGVHVQVQADSGLFHAPWISVDFTGIGAIPDTNVAQWLGCEITAYDYGIPFAMKCPLVRKANCGDSDIPGVCRLNPISWEDYSIDKYNAYVALGPQGSTTGPPYDIGTLTYADVVLPVLLPTTAAAKDGSILREPVTLTVTGTGDDGTAVSQTFSATLGAVAMVTNPEDLGWIKPATSGGCSSTKGVNFTVLLGSCTDSKSIQLAQQIAVAFAVAVVAAAAAGILSGTVEGILGRDAWFLYAGEGPVSGPVDILFGPAVL